MKYQQLLLTLILTILPIVCHAQYSGYIGDRISLDAPPTDNSRSYPDFFDATWKVTSGTRCVTLSPATGQHITAVVVEKGSATVTCSARYYNRSNLGAYYHYVNKSYTITCMEKGNTGGGGNNNNNSGYDNDDEDNGDGSFTSYNADGIPLRFTIVNNAFYGGECAKLTGKDNTGCVPTSTSGIVKVPSRVNYYTVFSIDGGAFWNLPYITDIIFPSTVGVYSDYTVWSGCTSLKSITVLSTRLPSYITDNAFDYTVYNNVTLYVPKGCKELYANATGFRKFKKIEEIGTDVSDITLNTTSAELNVGDCIQLQTTIFPDDATDKSVTWISDNESVAIVSNTGIVTALSEGEATITCRANDRSGKTASCSITVQERIPDYTIITSDDGYATFYDSSHDYVVPDGLIAQTVVGVNNGKLSYNVIADGTVSGIIPKGTAVVLVGSEKSAKKYNLSPSESSENYKGVNYLYGSDKPTTTDVTDTYYYYKLTYGNGNNSNVFGWYWGNSNGAAFNIEGHRAWLALPKSTTSTRSFSIDGDATGIEEIVQNEENNAIYDLLGRRIGRPNANVIYIKKGKKLLLNKTK